MPSILLDGNLRKKHNTRNHLPELPNYTVRPGNIEQTIVRMRFEFLSALTPVRLPFRALHY